MLTVIPSQESGGAGEIAADAPRLSVTLRPIRDIEAVGARWQALEARASASFFQSWGWIGCWLRLLPQATRPWLLEVHDGATLVAVGTLGRRVFWRRGLIRSQGLFLNETGDPAYDRLTIEYNGLMSDPALADRVAEATLAWLAANAPGWDEFFLSGLRPGLAARYEALAPRYGLRPRLIARKRCDYVDLGALRRTGNGYLNTLSRNMRYQLRRARRLYGLDESARPAVAGSVDEALGFLDRLKALHQASWKRRGQAGAFASRFFEDFHRTLIRDRFGAGEIQLLRIGPARDPIGYLYNFVKNDRVYAYQSGFRYDGDPKRKPGVVSHVMAIEHNLRSGAQVYDFMAGEGQHKASLGTHATELVWLALQRDRLRFRIEEGLRAVKRKVRGA